jgi:hypothetical protein
MIYHIPRYVTASIGQVFSLFRPTGQLDISITNEAHIVEVQQVLLLQEYGSTY